MNGVPAPFSQLKLKTFQSLSRVGFVIFKDFSIKTAIGHQVHFNLGRGSWMQGMEVSVGFF
jgi:hypothetical protein